jgi:hypothetical protein
MAMIHDAIVRGELPFFLVISFGQLKGGIDVAGL